MPIVRKDGFKLEGGEWFKKGFRKLLSLERNYFENILIKKLVFQNTKQKQQHQKNNRLFRKNNRLFRRNNQLFIPVCKYQNWI